MVWSTLGRKIHNDCLSVDGASDCPDFASRSIGPGDDCGCSILDLDRALAAGVIWITILARKRHGGSLVFSIGGPSLRWMMLLFL